MSRNLMYGLTVAAVVLVVVIGYQLIGGSNPGGPAATETPQPSVSSEPASAEPSTPADGSLPVGLHVMDPVSTSVVGDDSVTVTIPAPGWFAEPDGGSVTKDLGGDDRLTVVAVPADHYQVPPNICNWQTNPDLEPGNRIADTLDELVAYLAEQTYDTPEGSLTRELSTPVDITIDGYAGQSITGVVPAYPGSDPDGCDQQRFCSLLDRDSSQCLLPHLEPNALVTLWIVDLGDGSPHRRVVAASYWPTTRTDLLDEMNALVESMTFTID